MGLTEELSQAFGNHPVESKRPFVSLAYAQSLDGSIAVERGKPLAISGTESLRLTHRLRALHQAILVGIGTVLSDNPKLTVRHVQGNNPQPVILDSNLRLPVDSMLMTNEIKPWIMVSESIASESSKDESINQSGGRIFRVRQTESDRLDLGEVLSFLSNEGVKTLMVEGGAQVIQSFMKAGLVDWVVVTISPMFVGGLKAFEDLVSMDTFPRLHNSNSTKYGNDLVVWGKVN